MTHPKNFKDLDVLLDTFWKHKISPGEKKVFMVRHAESEGNKDHLIYGHSDYKLTEKGYIQASKVG